MSENKTLILWRHGQTDLNVQKRIQGAGVNSALNQVGRAQAVSAAAELAKLPIVRIVSSPLIRAQQTAMIAAQLLGLPVATDDRLKERGFGKWEGLTGDEIKAQWPDAFTTWRDFGDPDNGGEIGVETRAEVGQRVADCLRCAAQEWMEPGETWLFVSHGSACTQGVITLLGLDPGKWSGIHGLDNCHWAVLQDSARAPGWQLRGYNLGDTGTALI